MRGQDYIRLGFRGPLLGSTDSKPRRSNYGTGRPENFWPGSEARQLSSFITTRALSTAMICNNRCVEKNLLKASTRTDLLIVPRPPATIVAFEHPDGTAC